MNNLLQDFKLADKYCLWLIGLLGLVTVVLSVRTAVLIFDDLQLPEGFAELNTAIGYLRAPIAVFFGAGLSAEYRSYGMSRAIQMLIWDFGGSNAELYATIISVTQAATSLAIYSVLRRCQTSRTISLTAAIMWLCSPFAITHCFHHYSYLILPWQIIIALSYYICRMGQKLSTSSKAQRALAYFAGCALATTGEAHVIGAVAVLWLVSSRYSAAARRWTLLIASGFVVMLVSHYLIWRNFIFDASEPQRFSLSLLRSLSLYRLTTDLAIICNALAAGLFVQVKYIYLHSAGNLQIVGVASVLALMVLISFPRLVTFKAKNQTNTEIADALSFEKGKTNIFRVAWLICLTSGSVYFAIMLATGNVDTPFPRRYGYVFYTFLSICVPIYASKFLETKTALFVSSVFVMAYLGLYAQMQLRILPEVRAEDSIISNEIKQTQLGCEECPVIFQTGSTDEQLLPYNAIPGLRGGGTTLDLIESPYVAYWVQALYVKSVLGLKFFGWKAVSRPGDRISLVENASRMTQPFEMKSVKVIANVANGMPGSVYESIHTFESWPRYTANHVDVRFELGSDYTTSLIRSLEGISAIHRRWQARW